MPSTSIVDYQVLSDSNFTLNESATQSEPEEITLKFAVPDDIHATSALARRPILAFKVRPFSNSQLKVFFDHEEILSTSFDASSVKGYWEAVNLGPALKQHGNPVDVRFFLVAGRARFGDVVMWYQINR